MGKKPQRAGIYTKAVVPQENMDESKMHETKEQEHESLGQFLRNTRVSRAIELKQITEETRISGSNLRAMEADDFGALPADAFTRGFYALYAKALQLDPDEVVARFLMERGSEPVQLRQASSQTPLPGRMARQVSSMAEPANSSPMSNIGFILLVLIIFAGGICIYLSINPAAYLSEKLRQLQHVETESPSAASETSLPQPENTNRPAPSSAPE